ncbi:MAG: RDD family protein [Acidobacteria bacterium]|nr:RDD family protein [Acidobacteriota bacterium]
MNWFYELGGERKGPVGVQDLASLVRAGTISDSNLVWREGLAGWQPLSAMRGEILAAAGGDTAVLVATGLSTLVNLAISSGYEIFMIGSRGQTLGKMAMSLKVVRADGSALGYGLAAGRYFSSILSAIILMIGYLMALWDPEKRALHDRICETRVIKTK